MLVCVLTVYGGAALVGRVGMPLQTVVFSESPKKAYVKIDSKRHAIANEFSTLAHIHSHPFSHARHGSRNTMWHAACSTERINEANGFLRCDRTSCKVYRNRVHILYLLLSLLLLIFCALRWRGGIGHTHTHTHSTSRHVRLCVSVSSFM